MPKVVRILLPLILLCAAAGAAYWFWPKKVAARPNIILLSIDTLRADRVGAYGYNRPTTPFIDSLAKESVVFRNTVTAAPWTLPSHVTMFTGLYPTSHGVVQAHDKISKDLPLLAEILKRAGYKTAAFTGGGYVSAGYGFSRGFSTFVQNRHLASDGFDFGNTVERAEELLKSRGDDKRPYFIFLHTYDVHCPYAVPEKYQQLFKSSADYIDPGHCGEDYYNKLSLTESQGKYLADQYDGSIRAVDDTLSGFVKFLETQPDYDNTILIITSDHGEEFLEHGLVGHQHSLYRALLMVPLIMHVPGVAPKEVHGSVSLVDLFPTVLDLAGAPIPGAIDGASLKPYLEEGDELAPKRNFQIVSTDRGQSMRSLISDDAHLIVSNDDGSKLLFDVKNDPLEHNNTCATDQQRCERLHEALLKAFNATHQNAAKNKESIGDENIEQLKSLGYMK